MIIEPFFALQRDILTWLSCHFLALLDLENILFTLFADKDSLEDFPRHEPLLQPCKLNHMKIKSRMFFCHIELKKDAKNSAFPSFDS